MLWLFQSIKMKQEVVVVYVWELDRVSELLWYVFSGRLCKEHGRTIEYVCQTDGMLICAHCAILGPHRSDLGHKVGPIDKLVSHLAEAT